MAINPLTGTDTSFGLYGTPQQAMPMQARQFPAWMTNAQARGIGVAQQFNAPRIAPIDIPRGDGMGGFNNQMVAPPLQPMQDFGGGQQFVTEGGAGGGAVGGFNDTVSNMPASGLFADLLGYLGMPAGAANQPSFSGYGIEVAPVGYGGGIAGEPGTPGFGGGTATSGTTGEFGGAMGEIGGGSSGGDSGAPGGGMDSGGSGGMGGMGDGAGGGFSHGGHVTRNRLHGPDPSGPDDGYAALNIGEGIITAEAMKHYGKGILSKLNKLQVPKGAFGKK